MTTQAVRFDTPGDHVKLAVCTFLNHRWEIHPDTRHTVCLRCKFHATFCSKCPPKGTDHVHT